MNGYPTPPKDRKLGYIPKDPAKHPFGTLPCSSPWDMELIPEDEWKDRIDALNMSGADLLTLTKNAGMEAKDQDGWGFCWSYGGTRAGETARVAAGLKHIELSAFGCAYTIMNGRDRGGNTFDIIPFLGERGAPSERVWPNLEKRPAASEQEIWDDAKQHMLLEWYEMQDNNFNQKMTALLTGFPVCAGYMHWGHMVCDLVPMYREVRGKLEYGVRGWNSWGKTWGPYGDGTYELWGRKAISFDQVTVRATNLTPE